MAANPMWDKTTCRSAIAFLGEIYRNDEMWGRQAIVKLWILNILMQLSALSGEASQSIAISAETLLRELEASEDMKKRDLYRVCRESGPVPYSLGVSQPKLDSPSLLDRVQNRPDVEGNIRMLRKQRTKERGNFVYIPPQAKASVQAADDTRFLLMEKVKGFLESDQKVFLLMGDSGAGKSTFNRELEFDLWQSYKNKSDRIPLHIDLPAIDKPEHDMIAKQLRRCEFTEPQIREMKHYRKFILICDGYDESQQTQNLYMSNRLNQSGEWDAQMVISCRSEHVGSDYRDRFQPINHNQRLDSSLFQEAVITPFSTDQIHAYIKQYVSMNEPLWRVEDYTQVFERTPSLKDLMRNPLLMTLSLDVLPRMMDPGQTYSRVTRLELYDHFVEQWLERGKKRLSEKDMTPQARAVFESLSIEGFTESGIDFLKRLSAAIYKEQDGQPIVQYSRYKDGGSWKAEFFGRDDEKQLLLQACPLTRNGNQFRLIHRSLMEYGLTLAIFDPRDTRNARLQEVADIDEEYLASPLVWRNFVNDSSVLQFLGELAQYEPSFKQRLLEFIELSKKDKKWCTAASNAITILVRAGVQFNSADLQGIRIPGANLSYGVFDSAQLQEADLGNVNLCGAWLRQADLTKAQMSGAQFGDLPSLIHDSMVLSCAYSPDGTSLAVSLEDGDINVYSTSNWEKVQTLKGHDGSVSCVVYSPQGSHMVSASSDTTVRLWDTESGTCQKILTGHTEGVSCIAFPPQGDQVASASNDKTVRLWDIVTGGCRRILSGHNAVVASVVYSPQGNQLASGGVDCTVRLWDVESGDCSHILSDHSDAVSDVAFSPQGYQIASASYDRTVRVWNAGTGECIRILSGHSSDVCSVAYSPKGDQIASGCEGGAVTLWNAETGICHRALTGHIGAVFSVSYSPSGGLIASVGGDRMLRLWDVSIGASRSVSSHNIRGILFVKYSPEGGDIICSLDNTIQLYDIEARDLRREFHGHSDKVSSAVYSPRGDQMASGSADMTVRLWDIQSGTCQHSLTGHSDGVNCIAYSPEGDQIASSSNDKTVRLWDPSSGECQQTLSGHNEGVMSVVYFPGGNQLASCSADNTVRLWDIAMGVCSRILSGHSGTVYNAAFSPQGHQLASASADTTVRIWGMETGECHNILTGHDDEVTRVRYSDEGEMVASSSLDGTVRLWDVASGQSLAVVQTYQQNIFDIAWSATPEGNYLATGCRDGPLLIWQVIREREQYLVRFRWAFAYGPLTLTGATIQDVHGLSDLNKRLMEQYGAEGTPASPN
ncbi:WD_REPEATS_REGION domain-containing protein [Mortierella sp. NVP85]|nr:WD_REPEATS_REGION domain-containing protein [Mortierella sp. NVP85]